MTHLQIVGHAHAAVQLHRLLTDEAAGVSDNHLRPDNACRRSPTFAEMQRNAAR